MKGSEFGRFTRRSWWSSAHTSHIVHFGGGLFVSWTSVGNALRSHPASIGAGHRHPDCDSSFLPRPCCYGWVAASSVSSEGVSSTEQAKGDETRRDKTEMQTEAEAAAAAAED